MRKDELPDDYEELDFSLEEETWNDYELSDGNRLRARLILKKIRRDPNNPAKIAFDLVPPIFVITSMPANRGEKNHEPNPQEAFSLPHFEIKIKNSNERANIYRILETGQTLRIKLSVNKIDRVTARFDNEGQPYYLVNAGPLVTMDPPNLTSGQ